jgi:hypothetical protein
MIKPLAYLATTSHCEQGLYFLEDEAKAYSVSDTTSPDKDYESVVPLIAIPTPLSEDEMRARFEDFYAQQIQDNRGLVRTDRGEYKWIATNNMWITWQAAISDITKRMED